MMRVMLQDLNQQNPLPPFVDSNGGQRDEQRVSPGGPDGHHHDIKT